jgi:hypothetical protein
VGLAACFAAWPTCREDDDPGRGEAVGRIGGVGAQGGKHGRHLVADAHAERAIDDGRAARSARPGGRSLDPHGDLCGHDVEIGSRWPQGAATGRAAIVAGEGIVGDAHGSRSNSPSDRHAVPESQRSVRGRCIATVTIPVGASQLTTREWWSSRRSRDASVAESFRRLPGRKSSGEWAARDGVVGAHEPARIDVLDDPCTQRFVVDRDPPRDGFVRRLPPQPG